MEGDTTVTEGPTYEDKLKFVSVIAKPMASKKLTKKIYKVSENLSPGLWELVHNRDHAPRVIVIPGACSSPSCSCSHKCLVEFSKVFICICQGHKLDLFFGISHGLVPARLFLCVVQVIKKGSKQKTFVRNGLKDVQARIRKGEKGLVIFAGDVTPIEVTRMI